MVRVSVSESMSPPFASKTVTRSSTERPCSHVSILNPLNTSSGPASAPLTVVQSPSKQMSADLAPKASFGSMYVPVGGRNRQPQRSCSPGARQPSTLQQVAHARASSLRAHCARPGTPPPVPIGRSGQPV